ncbi:guanine deaminase [Elsinoe ampelina]|uniref:Guanine deaminase n=1 Tax=Elsinoe ampelina TaxID=302913 RepID=A0A6A6GLB1_9PEZI|nr:guanine deaminase [Elsinoe ampelina]
MSLQPTIYVGPLIHHKSLTELEILPTASIYVDAHGKIAHISPTPTPPPAGFSSARTIHAPGPSTFFFPGFIDTHTHAPQFPNAGLFGATTLLSWLETYTFPTESRFSSLPFAKQVYSRVVKRLLSHGTTTAAYYATVHVPATNLLAEICHAAGQRAFVGRVCMDRDGFVPGFYRDESAAQGVVDSRASIEFCRALDPEGDLVQAIVTPRFAPACSEEALRGLGELVRETGVRVQTHVSENRDEVRLVGKLFPEDRDYVGVYDRFGLLGERTVLAHAIWLSEEEKRLVKERKAKLSHCPCSNTCLTSGAMKVKDLLAEGIDVGLGTDASGGYSASMLEEVRQAILVSRHVAMVDGEKAKLSFEEALWLATKGGAKVLGLEDKVGSFEVGMDWDAQMISLGQVDEDGTIGVTENLVDVYGEEKWIDRVAKWVYAGDDRNTSAVWVKGRLVHKRTDVSF